MNQCALVFIICMLYSEAMYQIHSTLLTGCHLCEINPVVKSKPLHQWDTQCISTPAKQHQSYLLWAVSSSQTTGCTTCMPQVFSQNQITERDKSITRKTSSLRKCAYVTSITTSDIQPKTLPMAVLSKIWIMILIALKRHLRLFKSWLFLFDTH